MGQPGLALCPWLHLSGARGPVSCRYFEGGVSSVYLWDLDHGFAGVILIKKAGDGSKKIKGCWDSIHVVEVQVQPRGSWQRALGTALGTVWQQSPS